MLLLLEELLREDVLLLGHLGEEIDGTLVELAEDLHPVVVLGKDDQVLESGDEHLIESAVGNCIGGS